MSNESVGSKELQLLTIEYVPGREIDRALGTVLGHGDTFFGTSQERVSTSRATALAEMRRNAQSSGADAIIGVNITVTGVKGFWGILGGGQSAVVQAYGTAVKLKPKARFEQGADQ